MKSTLFGRSGRLFLLAATLSLTACGTLSPVSPEGTANIDDLRWPDAKTLTHNQSKHPGSWPNWDNVRLIQKGMNKKQLFALIGHPHFEEGFAPREWDYLFNYYENGKHKTCQFKVLFNKERLAQSFFWYPNACQSDFAFTLELDALFGFNQYHLLPEGVRIIEQVAKRLQRSQATGATLIGHADPIGNEAYNLQLSERRAQTIRQHLQAAGLDIPLQIEGRGESEPVVRCDAKLKGKALQDCHKPNRRAEVVAKGITRHEKAGTQGPQPLTGRAWYEH